MRVLGSQVGQFVARRHAEAEVRASESRLRAMLEAALDAVVTMDHRGRVIGWNHAAETTFGYRAHEAIGQRHGGADRPAALRDRPTARASRASSRPSARSILDRRLELTGDAQERHRVPGRADDHADRRCPGRRRSPATCATSPTASGPRPSCAPRARVSSRSPTRSGGGSSATSTTARSSGSPRCCSTLGRLRAQAATATGRLLDARDRRARGRARRRSASSRAACIRRCSPSAGSRAALEALALRAPVPVELAAGARPAAARAGRGGGVLRRRRGARERAEARRRAGSSSSAPRPTTPGSLVEVVDDGVGGADPRGRGAARARRPRRGARRDARGRQPGRGGHARARPVPARLIRQETEAQSQDSRPGARGARGAAAAAPSVFRQRAVRSPRTRSRVALLPPLEPRADPPRRQSRHRRRKCNDCSHHTQASARDRVALHAARVRGGDELAVLALDGADAAERPRRRDVDVVPARPESPRRPPRRSAPRRAAGSA